MRTITPPLEDITFRPSIWSHLGNLLLSVIFIILGIPSAYFISQSLGKGNAFLIWSIFLALGLAFFLQALWKCYNQRLCFCNQYVSAYSGILSPSMKTTRLLYEHVRGVEIEQSLYQRLINLGDLHVGSDVNKGESEMLVCGIKNPDLVKDQLLERVRLSVHPVALMQERINQA